MISFGRRRLRDRVVGVADAQVSLDPTERLITYGLGSCLGVVVYDPVAVVAGLLHAQLPTRDADRGRSGPAPSTYVDTGMVHLLRACVARGARPERLRIAVAGGAAAREGRAGHVGHAFHIGQRNLETLDSVLARLGLAVHARDTGGIGISRTMWVDVATGDVTLNANGTSAPMRMNLLTSVPR